MQKWNNVVLAKTLGWSLIIMFFLGIFAEFIVRSQLINWENPGLTFLNLQESSLLFESGIFAFILIINLDIIISIVFYLLFKKLNNPLSLLMTSLRLVYVAIKASAIVGLFLARDVFSSITISETQIDEYAQLTMQFLKMHQYGFAIGLIIFGIHLIMLAFILIKHSIIPKLIIWLLLLGGIGYYLNSIIGLFFNDDVLQNIFIAIFIIPMTFSELSLGMWLWIKSKSIINLSKT